MGQNQPFDYDSIHPGYYDDVYHRRWGSQCKWHHLKFGEVAAQIPRCDSQLDVGCGPGTFIGMYANAVRAVGVDVSARQIEYASRKYGRGGRDFLNVSPGTLPFGNDEFDVVTAIELIEHIEMGAIRGLVAEMVRVLKPGGLLVLTTPNYGSLWPLLERAVNAFGPVSYDDQHISHFTRRSLETLMREYPLTHIAVRAYMGLAAFTAPLHWKFSDRVHALENRWQLPFLSFSLLAAARKA